MTRTDENFADPGGTSNAVSTPGPLPQSVYILDKRPSGRAALCLLLFLLFLNPLGWSQQNNDWTKEELAWREHRAALLLSDPPHGWLSVVGLEWLAEGVSVSVGSDSDNAIRLDHCSPHLGVFHLNHGKVTITANLPILTFTS